MTSTTVAEACRKTLSGGSRRNVMRQPEGPWRTDVVQFVLDAPVPAVVAGDGGRPGPLRGQADDAQRRDRRSGVAAELSDVALDLVCLGGVRPEPPGRAGPGWCGSRPACAPARASHAGPGSTARAARPARRTGGAGLALTVSHRPSDTCGHLAPRPGEAAIEGESPAGAGLSCREPPIASSDRGPRPVHSARDRSRSRPNRSSA